MILTRCKQRRYIFFEALKILLAWNCARVTQHVLRRKWHQSSRFQSKWRNCIGAQGQEFVSWKYADNARQRALSIRVGVSGDAGAKAKSEWTFTAPVLFQRHSATIKPTLRERSACATIIIAMVVLEVLRSLSACPYSPP